MSPAHAKTVSVPRQTRTIVIFAITAASVVIAWLGQPAPVVASILFLATTRLASRYGWLLSWALVLVASALAIVGLLRISVYAAPDIGVLVTSVWTILALGFAAAEVARPARTFSGPSLASLMTASVTPVVLGLIFLGRYLESGGRWIGWAMPNDTAWRTRIVRWTLEDGGSSNAHTSPDPLTTVLNAAWSGRSFASERPGTSLEHIVVQSGQLTILVWLTVSLTIAAITLATLSRRPVGLRIVGSLAIAVLPWTWFMTGYAFEYGFQNAGPAVLMLIAAWLMWRNTPLHPAVCTAGLVLATVALVITWAPLGVAGAALLAAAIWHQRRQLLRAAPAGWGLIVASVIVATFFAVTVTLVTLQQNSTAALANEGAMLTFHPARTAIVTVLVALVGAVIAHRVPASRQLWLGAAFVLVGVGAACAALLYLRRDMDALWGYYPIKFVWLVSSAAILVLASELLEPVSRIALSRWRGNGAFLVAALSVGAMFMISSKPPTTAAHASPVNLLNANERDSSARAVVELFGRDPSSLVSAYSRGYLGVENDGFINFWLLQINAPTDADPLRGQAYVLDSSSPASVCATLRVAEPATRVVWTSSPQHATELKRVCGELGLTVDVRTTSPPDAAD